MRGSVRVDASARRGARTASRPSPRRPARTATRASRTTGPAKRGSLCRSSSKISRDGRGSRRASAAGRRWRSCAIAAKRGASGSDTLIGRPCSSTPRDVAHPAGDRERGECRPAAGARVLAHGREQPLRQLLRAVHRDLLRAMRQRRDCAKRVDQRVAIGAAGRRRAARAAWASTSSAISRRM